MFCPSLSPCFNIFLVVRTCRSGVGSGLSFSDEYWTYSHLFTQPPRGHWRSQTADTGAAFLNAASWSSLHGVISSFCLHTHTYTHLHTHTGWVSWAWCQWFLCHCHTLLLVTAESRQEVGAPCLWVWKGDFFFFSSVNVNSHMILALIASVRVIGWLPYAGGILNIWWKIQWRCSSAGGGDGGYSSLFVTAEAVRSSRLDPRGIHVQSVHAQPGRNRVSVVREEKRGARTEVSDPVIVYTETEFDGWLHFSLRTSTSTATTSRLIHSLDSKVIMISLASGRNITLAHLCNISVSGF